MKNLLKVIAGLIAVFLLLVGALAVALPGLINSEDFKTALHDSAADALGTPLEWQSLEAGLLPPRLVIQSPVLGGASENPDDARLTAESIDLRLALLPIFLRRVQVDSLVLHGIELVVTRTADGFILPMASEQEGSPPPEVVESPGSASEADDGSTEGGEEEFELALRRLVISKSRVVVRDRTLARPIEWRFEEFRLEARGGDPREPLDIDVSARVQSGTTAVGKIESHGTVTLGGIYDLDVMVEDLLLAELQPYISDATVAGRMTGRISVDGATSALKEVDLDLRIDEMAVRTFGLDLQGGLELEARQAYDDPADFEARLDLGSGGVASFVGKLSLEGAVEAAIALESLDIAPYAQLAGSEIQVTGLATGDVEIAATAEGGLSHLKTDLKITSAHYRDDNFDVGGVLDLGLGLEGTAQDDPIRFDIGMKLDRGGHIDAEGVATMAGAVDAAVVLGAFDLGLLAPIIPEGRNVSGQATGDVAVRLRADREIERLTTKLRVASAHYRDDSLDVGGTLDLTLGLEGLGAEDPVRFDIGMEFDRGGRFDAKGVATTSGSADAVLALKAVDLELLAPFMPEGTSIFGQVTGDADVRITAEREVERLDTKLKIASARVVSDPVDLSGQFDLAATLEDKGPIELSAGLVLSDGGRLDLTGTSTPEGVVDLKAQIEKFDLSIAKPFLPDPEMQIGGFATGSLRCVGEIASPEFVGVDVGIESGLLRMPDYFVEGPFLAEMKVKYPLSDRPRGQFELDLSAAALEYQDQFKKRAGMRAVVTTKFVPEESGEIVFESRVKLRDIDEILLQGAVGKSTSVAVTTSNFNLKGWSEVLPVLEPYAPDGIVALDGIGVELAEGVPTQFGGRLTLRGVGITIPDTGQLRLRGSILGEGRQIRTKGLQALIGGMVLGIDVRIEDPLDDARFDLAVKSVGDAEVNDLLSALTTTRDTVYGNLEILGNIEGEAGTETGLYESLDGSLRFTIGEKGGGRLRGVSILRSVLDQVPLLGGAARLTQPFRGGRSVDDYFTEEFEVIEGDFEIGGGKVNAKTLRLSYEGYEAKLFGPIRLRDLTIDMTGEILMKKDLVSTIGGLAGADMDQRKPIRIPLARVTNTLTDPKIVMTKETLAAIPKLLFQATGLDTIATGVGDAIGRALGGGSK